jgi:hypothetical protein
MFLRRHAPRQRFRPAACFHGPDTPRRAVATASLLAVIRMWVSGREDLDALPAGPTAEVPVWPPRLETDCPGGAQGQRGYVRGCHKASRSAPVCHRTRNTRFVAGRGCHRARTRLACVAQGQPATQGAGEAKAQTPRARGGRVGSRAACPLAATESGTACPPAGAGSGAALAHLRQPGGAARGRAQDRSLPWGPT